MNNKYLKEPLSNYDLMRVISKDMKMRGNIVDTREINQYDDVDDLFNNRGHAILYEPPESQDSDVGHWTCTLRTKEGNCIYFDSYGGKLENPQLRKLLNTEYGEIQYNPHQLQGYDSSVCGRYALACVCLNKIIPNLTVEHIIEFFKNKPKNMSYDKYVLDMTGII